MLELLAGGVLQHGLEVQIGQQQPRVARLRAIARLVPTVSRVDPRLLAPAIRSPTQIGGANRFDKPVVDQLDPGVARSGLCPHQKTPLQLAHCAVGQAAGHRLALANQVAGADVGDQLLLEPGAQLPRAGRWRARHLGELLHRVLDRDVIKTLQRLVDVARLLQILESDVDWLLAPLAEPPERRGDRQRLPELVTHHLKLHRLDILPLDRVLLAGHAHLQEVLHQLFGHAGGKRTRAQLGRLAHRFESRRLLHALHEEGGVQPVEHQRLVRIQRRHIVLAQRQQHPQVGIVHQRLVELAKKVLPLLPAARMSGDDLLELVQDQDIGRGRGRRLRLRFCRRGLIVERRPVLAAETVQKALQRQAGKTVGVADALVQQAGHQVEEEDVVDAGDGGGQVAADTRHRQHSETVLLQVRNQAGVDEGTLARAGLGVEKQQPLRHDARRQIARLALAAKEEPSLLAQIGARANIWIAGDLGCRCHGNNLIYRAGFSTRRMNSETSSSQYTSSKRASWRR